LFNTCPTKIYDGMVGNLKVDAKKTASGSHVLGYIQKAIGNQGADTAVIEFDLIGLTVIKKRLINCRYKKIEKKNLKTFYFFSGKEDVVYTTNI
jgi:hypothetical protein